MPPFVHRLPVRFADIDHAGIVYYPRFFHFFHVAFEELWRARIGPRAYSELIDRDPPAVTSDLELANKYALFIDEIERPDDRRPGRWDFLHNWTQKLTPEQ